MNFEWNLKNPTIDELNDTLESIMGEINGIMIYLRDQKNDSYNSNYLDRMVQDYHTVLNWRDSKKSEFVTQDTNSL